MTVKLYKNSNRLLFIFGAFLILSTTLEAANIHPLEPPDTSSPRATLMTFLGIMRENKALKREDYFARSKATRDRDEQLEKRAELLFDFRDIPIERVEDVTNKLDPMLADILDRIELPPETTIPDADTVKTENLSRWTIPHTEITLVKIEDGRRQGEWLFSADTVQRMPLFYDKVKGLPYRPDAIIGTDEVTGLGIYESNRLFPEETFPSEWIVQLPVWAKVVTFENPVWKWLAFGLILLIGYGLFTLIRLASRKWENLSDPNKVSLKWWRLLPPVSGALLAISVEYLIDEQINAVGMADVISETGLLVISLIFWAWAVIELGGIVSRAFVRSWRKNIKGVHHYLASIMIRILSIVIAVWIVIFGVERFGLSIMPILAGLGVGGIAIALAVRPTLENLIGGIILFIDKPIEVGDLCRYSSPTGSQVGIVEKIGLRSTRIRKYEDTLITIPNAEFSQLQIENLSSREMTLLRFTLSLRYETTADQLRFVLTHLRIMLIGHPEVSPERLRVRFKGFGDSSLDVEIFAYIRTNAYPEYWAIREDINLRIIDVVNDAGTGFAFPSQTTYLTQDTGLDKEKIRRSEEKVEDWRSDHTLPFPEIEEEEQEKIEDILDYPPAGSPSYRPDRYPSPPDKDTENDRSSSHSMKTKNWKWKRQQWTRKSD